MIHRRQKFAVSARAVLMLDLHMGSFNMPLVHESLIITGWTAVDSPWATVVGDPIHRHVVDNRSVVDVNVGDVHIVDGAVVKEGATMPVTKIGRASCRERV